jgi:hypothetical protein
LALNMRKMLTTLARNAQTVVQALHVPWLHVSHSLWVPLCWIRSFFTRATMVLVISVGAKDSITLLPNVRTFADVCRPTFPNFIHHVFEELFGQCWSKAAFKLPSWLERKITDPTEHQTRFYVKLEQQIGWIVSGGTV